VIVIKRLFEKNRLLFALLWIGIYVVGFSAADGASEAIGMPKLITALLGLLLTWALCRFLGRNGLRDYVGLRALQGNLRQFLWFVPLVPIATASLWGGVQWNDGALMYVASMIFVGILEEIIFRGLLFQAMRPSGLLTAVIVSSVSFGMGHIVNLLSGAPLLGTLLQLIYASAVGFCFTAIFIAGGSIVPCIIAHVVVNSLSAFAPQWGAQTEIVVAAVVTIIALSYGLCLYKRRPLI